MEKIRATRIWQNSLGKLFPPGSLEQDAVKLLEASFITMRGRAIDLTAGIPTYLRHFTVHDISHLDALWETADIVLGDSPEWMERKAGQGQGTFSLNPVEAFILGGAFLLHDLGMSITTYPGGLNEVKALPEWRRAMAEFLTIALNRFPSAKDLDAPRLALESLMSKDNNDRRIKNAFKKFLSYRPTDKELSNLAGLLDEAICGFVLRERHAEQARVITGQAWSQQGKQVYFIEPLECRMAFGELIGRIAFSHHLSVDEVEKEFGQLTIGSPGEPYLPQEWAIDPLKIALLLRVCDAAQLDSRRAPIFRRMLVSPKGESWKHWNFQAHLMRPELNFGQLYYHSKNSFTVDEVGSWWIAFSTCTMVDRELRDAFSLLTRMRPKQVFAAQGVGAVNTPESFSTVVKTFGWQPVDARVHISSVDRIVKRLGGWTLYGDTPEVFVREILQNAIDSVVAKRHEEQRADNWGQVTLSVQRVEGKQSTLLTVSDTGTGMSRQLLTGALLDFGESYWSSSLALKEHPYLIGSGFNSIGRFGIGFFSVFMVANEVSIHSRPRNSSHGYVLTFSRGLRQPPVLRDANEAEDRKLLDGGTRISLHVSSQRKGVKEFMEELLDPTDGEKRLLGILPASPVDLFLETQEGIRMISAANDWLSISPEQLQNRLSHASTENFYAYASMLDGDYPGREWSILKNSNGTIVGRISLGAAPHSRGIATIGGLFSTQLGVVSGILAARPIRASRDDAELLVEKHVIRAWATEQAQREEFRLADGDLQIRLAACVVACGGDPGSQSSEDWIR